MKTFDVTYRICVSPQHYNAGILMSPETARVEAETNADAWVKLCKSLKAKHVPTEGSVSTVQAVSVVEVTE